MPTHLTKFIRSTPFRFIIVLITLLGLLTILSEGFAVDVTAIVAQWQSPVGSSGAPTCLSVNNASPTVEVRFGDNDVTNPPCPPNSVQSGFGFSAGTTGMFTNGAPFLLGQLTHFNNQVFASSLLTGATLDLSFTSTAPVLPAIDTQVALDETANNMATCPYGDTQPCADRVTISPTSTQFTDNGITYQLEILGLIPGTAATCSFSQSNLRLSFISDENSDNSSCLYGRVTEIGDAEMEITKSTTATILAPGDFVDYQIDYNCASTTGTCNDVKIVDFLPDELSYVSSSGSIHTVATNGVYSSGSNTVEFDFINPLPAGSTGYVRVRAQVRNDGTLIDGQTITNTATSTQTNGPTTTSSTNTPVKTTSNWAVTKSGDATAYISSEPPITDMTYTVQICPNGSNVNLLNAQMVDTLPTGAVFVSASGGGVYSAGANTVTWSLGDLSIANGCNSQTIVVRFPNPPFTASNTVINNVTGTGTVPGIGPFSGTAAVTRVLQNFVPLPSMTMDKGTVRTDYVVGASVDYFLTPRNTGNTNLYNLVMTDDLPPAIRVTQVGTGVSAYPMIVEYAINGSSTYNTWASIAAGGSANLNVSSLPLTASDWITSIRWRFNAGAGTPPGWSLTSAARITGTVTSPDRNNNTVATPSQIVNNAKIDWAYLPGGLGDCNSTNAQCGTQQDGATIDIVPVPFPVFDKVSGGGVSANQRFIVGQQVGYFDLTVNNTTGIGVDNFILTDDIPAAFNVTSVNVGNYSNFSGTVGVRYQANNNAGVWVAWPGATFAQGTTLNTSALGLPANTYITKLEFNYGTIPLGFAGSARINGSTLAIDANGGTVADGDNMVNNATMDWTFMGLPHNTPDSTTNPIRNPTVTPVASKSVTSSGPYIPTSAVSYRLSFGASNSTPSNVMNDPVVADLLPANVNYVSYTFNANGTSLAAPTFVQIPNFGGTGRILLRWTFTGTINRGQTASIDLNTTLSAGTPSGTLSNTFEVSVNDMPINGGSTDTQDLDGDGQTNDTIFTASTSIPVDQLIGLDSQKRVRGELDSAYSVYPNYGQTVLNGSVDYRLTIINRGNVNVNNVRVIDILPFVGDTGVQDTRPRHTAWRPVLTGPVTPQAGVTIYYSTATNPCRPEIVSSGPSGCTAANWSLIPPANLDTVRSLRFDFAGSMAPGQSFAFNWSMRAPANGTDQSIAWNSFAYTSTNAVTGVPLRPAEPNKVGIILNTTPKPSLIVLKKYTNTVDADLAPGPDIPTTGTVTWTYVVTNIGQTRLANIAVTDDQVGAITCPKTVLDPNETMTCTFVSPTAPQLGQYANVGTVIGTAVDASNNPIDGDPSTPAIDLVKPTSTDPSHYFGYDPNLAILGDYTWIDLNYDGIQDSGEPPLGGVTVHLLNAAGVAVDDPTQAGTQAYITTSDASGFYNFVNLPAGDYKVKFDIPSAYSMTLKDVNPDTTDSDADTTTGITGVYHLNAGESNATVDAGFIALASIGDRIWMDTNGNGIQDASETATPALLEGLQVDLLDSTGATTMATTFTDAAGNYLFNDLIPGTYIIKFSAPPTGYIWTTQNSAGSTTDNDSDVNVASYRTVATALQAGENDPSWDAGLVTKANIGDYVWADNNYNGKQDSGEPGVAGVTVRLLDGNGNQATDDNGVVIPDVITNASGAYSFTNLRPGQYEIRFTRPAGYIFTTKDAPPSADTIDSDVVVSGANIGRTLVTTLDPSETDNTWDAGLVKLASIGDFVWSDTSDDGQQDVGETGVAGAIVTLLDSSGNPVTTDALGNAINPITTLANGAYSFTNLDPRVSYIVQFQRPVNTVFATPNSGSDSTDSDAVPSAILPLGVGRTGLIMLTAGQTDNTIDAGLVPAASIGDTVFYDNDNTGTQTGGDTPVQGVTVRLLDNTGFQAVDERGNVIPDQTSDASGFYHFTGLRPDTYSLAFSTLPTNYTFAQRDVGANDAVDSDPNRFTGLTVTTTLDPAEDDTSWDAGLVIAASLGDFVWIDVNANGQQDAGEVGLAGVTVNLLDGSGAAVDNPNTPAVDTYSATTDVNGHYQFVGLPPNLTYKVQFVRPSGYVFTTSNTGADSTDSDGVLTGQTTVANVTTINITTLLPGDTDNTWDQGVLLPSALGDVVWRDNNDDGLQTGGEPGINGVTVQLLDSSGAAVVNPNTGAATYTTTTNAIGTYAFTNLYPGDYIVEFVTPTGYKRADYFVGAGTNPTTDSDMQTSGVDAGRTPTITLPYDTTDNTWDAGFVPLAAIGNFVWRDINNNGIQDGGETGVAGAKVTLLDSTGTAVTIDGMGNAISPITTTASGAYSFTNLDPDIDYIVQFTLPTPAVGAAGYKFSPQDVTTGGGNDTNDSDADTTTGKTAIIPLNPGQTDNDRDAGMTPLAQIGDYVWVDTNGNGQQNGGEVGINNVRVDLYLSSDLTTSIANTLTANNPVGGAAGYYQFLNLDAGNYTVKFTLLSGYIFSRQDTGSDTTDSDANRFTGYTGSYTLAWGGSTQTVDAAIVQPASLGDYVWYDTNDDGLQTGGEIGQSGVVVRLLDTTNTAEDNPNTPANDTYVLTTDASGAYLFDNLIPGTYRVKFDLAASTLPQVSSNYVLARQDQGGNNAIDSDPNRSTGITADITLTPNQNDMSNDAGILLRGANLGDRVWIDINNNGVQDVGELGLNGVTVTLLNGAGGTDIDPITAGTQTLSMTTINNATIGNGYYQFTSLVPGTYIVQVTLPTGYQFSAQDQGADDTVDSDVNFSNGRTAVITVAADGSDQTWDAGLVPLASIGDYVWRDNNNNGLQDIGEPGLAGVVVHLLDSSNNPVDNPNIAGFQAYTYTTIAGGAYLFNNLPPSTSYIVQFDLPAHFRRSPVDANSNANDVTDSDADLTNGRSPATLLAPNEYNQTVDAGFVPLATIGDYVWNDADGDGVQDAGETGINGVTVNLYAASNLSSILRTTTTANNPVGGAPGYYQFADLDAGNYVVGFVKPSTYIFTKTDINSAATTPVSTDANDSDADRFSGQTGTYVINWGDSNQTIDAGVLQPATLGNYVWIDTDDDGVQDGTETGLNGVTVHLLDGSGNPVNDPNNATPTAYVVTTAGGGAYSFSGLFPGVYSVQFDLPNATYVFARQNINSGATTPASNDNNDSDADRTTGKTGNYTLIANQTDNSVDAGMMLRASLGDFVWNDVNGNGIQDSGELGVQNVTVTLRDGTGAFVDDPNQAGIQNYIVQTDSSGAYHFTNLIPGDYYVVFTLPSGYIFTRQDATADTADSDANRFTGRTITTTLTSGKNDLTWDAGILQPAALGNFVWTDTNDNGLQDVGELGLNGVTVQLLDGSGNPVNDPNNSTPTPYVVTTAAGGAYSFTGLFPGVYTVKFNLPNATYVFARQDQGSDDTVDSDADRTTGKTGSYTLTANLTDNSVDAGILARASLGDFVWNDVNGNGVQDSGELGVQNVTVTLYNSANAQVDNPNTPAVDTYVVQTDASGAYSFTNLVPGDYYVVFTLPSGYIFTQQDAAAATDATDSDAVRLGATQGRTITTTLISGENDLTWDAGILQPATLGNFVWIDTDDDGVQDPAETGLLGVTVHLLDGSGNPVNDPNNATPTPYVATTDGSGAYSFSGLFPGVYSVQFDLPNANYVFARQNINSGATTPASNDNNDSDADRTSGKTGNYTLIANQTDNSVDAGMMLRTSLGDFVWNDINGNGVQDSGELGVQNVTVMLYNGANVQVDNPNTPAVDTYVVQTDASGAYHFTNLIPGDYYVVFTLPSGYIFTRQDAAAATDSTDSDADRFNGRTITTTLTSGENDLTWDAGILQPAALGNYVWTDTNDNGLQDSGETGLNGVTVQLLDGSGNPVNDPNNSTPTPYIVTTAGSGAYAFTGLFPGVYTVKFNLPNATYVFARQDQGSDDTVDSDADRTTGVTGSYPLTANLTDNSVDAGMMLRASLGDFVWNDVNGNGVQDSGELGVQNVTVTLYNGANVQVDNPNTPAVDTYVVQTDASGAYSFTNLIPGDYYVVFTLPSGYMFTQQDAAAATDATDSDAVRLGANQGQTITTTLISGENDLTWDAGILQPATLGNFVWVDTDDDGVQDPAETGLDGVTVHLLNGSGNPVNDPNNSTPTPYVVTTVGGGAYSFSGLFPGVYSVQFDLPNANYVFAHKDINSAATTPASDDTTDSDADRTSGKTGNYTLIANQTDNSVDAGMMLRASLGDYVWNDINGNGIQDGGETGVQNVTVTLYNGANGQVDNPNTPAVDTYVVQTDSSGAYTFTNLIPGDYYVVFTLPSGYIFTQQDAAAATDSTDSDAVRLGTTQGHTITTTLISGENDLTWDAGILQPAALGNYVWTDTNDNGIQDPAETGLNGVTVHLLDGSGNPVNDPNNATPTPYVVTTVGGGAYAFTGLFPGVYTVQFDLPNATYVFARQNQGADDSIDSDADLTTGRTGTYTLTANLTDNTVDAGMLERASIGDFVWLDMNYNGIQDVGEVGLQGVTIYLTDENGVVTSTTSGVNGAYSFTNLVPGNYSLQFVLPSALYKFSAQNQGSNPAKDSDADFTTGNTVITHLTANENDTTWDAGIIPLASIGDRVWIDLNNNGIQDSGEADYPNATVNLLNASGTVINTTITNGTGNYLFEKLSPGQYAIEVVLPAGYQFSPQDQGAADASDSDVNFVTGRTIVTMLDAGENDMSWDAGIVPLVSIGDRVWLDMNNNGILDPIENGAPNVTVHLLNSAGTIIGTKITDATGNYLFDLLPPGDYRIEFVLPAGYQFSPQDLGGDDSKDSDALPTTGRTIVVNLPPNTHDTTRDAGIVPLVSIGDFVWRDNNGNGIQDSGEPGLAGVTVRLLGGPSILTTTTDASGKYLFDLLPPGDYSIEVVPPNHFMISPKNAGSDPAADSDIDQTTGRSVTTTLDPGEHDLSWDAGLAPLASIGDFVWIDSNGDGIQDSGEPGIIGVTVHLLDAGGALLSTTTTDANGKYLFDNLKPADYIIEVVKPAAYEFSPRDAGSNDTLDSDVSLTTGRSIATTLDYGENDLTWDAGIVKLGSIGDRVWFDNNNNGVQDAGEKGIPNVKVTLTYPDLTTVSVFTDSNGKYLFPDLPDGAYTVTVDKTTLPAGMGQTYDLDGTLDDSTSYNLAIGETVLTLDFGYVELGSIGDTIWLDANRNGKQDVGELGIPNVTVTLVFPDGTTLTTTTDANGNYLFPNLYPGVYVVIVDLTTLPPGVGNVYDPDGSPDSKTTVNLGAGENHLTADFGYAPPAPFGAVTPTPLPTPPIDAVTPTAASACLRSCVDWQLYHSNQSGDWEIYRLDKQGDHVSVSTNLSQGKGADDVAPTRSPNAQWIVFSSNRDGNWELYLAPTNGDASLIRRLTYNTVAKDTDPVWGPNNYVVYETTRDGNWELYMLDMTTGKDRRLTNNSASDINAYWSTDGKKLLFQSNRSGLWQIYELDIATNVVKQLSDGKANDVDGQYSNDSSRISFRSYRDGAKSTLYIMNADGSGLKRISDVKGDATNQSWSTDDSLIAYQSDLDGDLDIYVYQVGTGITRKLTDNKIPDYAPTWLCNGTIVIFTSDVDGNPNIFDADAVSITAPAIDVQKDAQRLTTDPADDVYPENAPVEENASREGHLPGINLGDQTDFLVPDVTVTKVDRSLDTGKAWEPMDSCAIDPSEDKGTPSGS